MRSLSISSQDRSRRLVESRGVFWGSDSDFGGIDDSDHFRGCGDSSRIDDGCGEVDHCIEALVCFACSHGDALELFEFTEEVFDQMAPFIHLGVDLELWARPGCCEMTIFAPR